MNKVFLEKELFSAGKIFLFFCFFLFFVSASVYGADEIDCLMCQAAFKGKGSTPRCRWDVRHAMLPLMPLTYLTKIPAKCQRVFPQSSRIYAMDAMTSPNSKKRLSTRRSVWGARLAITPIPPTMLNFSLQKCPLFALTAMTGKSLRINRPMRRLQEACVPHVMTPTAAIPKSFFCHQRRASALPAMTRDGTCQMPKTKTMRRLERGCA
jgi:hypothetical protein